MSAKTWFHRNISYRFNKTGRFVKALEDCKFSKFLGNQYKDFIKFADRQQHVPHRQGIVLKMHMNSDEGPWILWGRYDFIDWRGKTGLRFGSVFIPQDITDDSLPEGLEDYAIFEVNQP